MMPMKAEAELVDFNHFNAATHKTSQLIQALKSLVCGCTWADSLKVNGFSSIENLHTLNASDAISHKLDTLYRSNLRQITSELL